MSDDLEHQVTLKLASDATLTLLYFSSHDQRWIYSYDYVGAKVPGRAPELACDVRLTADFIDGLLAATFVLSMHVVVPSRLGKSYLAGMDVSPGAKTYLEFTYVRHDAAYRLSEICKGARDRVRLADLAPALVKPVEFPFPVLDHVPIEGQIRVPFRTNQDQIAHFDLPVRTLR